MQKHSTNLRHAEETTAPRQAFAAPQDEIRHIKRTDQTLTGFARILEIIRDTDFFEIDQSKGHVQRDWLARHSTQCGACVGALLCWFFDGPVRSDDTHCFMAGIEQLAKHLGVGETDAGRFVDRCRTRVARRTGAEPDIFGPFGDDQWHADYAETFKELARQHPGK